MIKKTLFLLPLIGMSFISQSFSQRVDLDRFYFDVSYQKLPQVIIPESERSYGVRTKVGEALKSFTNENEIYDNLIIHGFKKVEDKPKIGVDFTLDDFIYKGSSVKNKTEEQKDKDGKVTGRTTTYWIEATYVGRGNCIFQGPLPPKKVEEKKVEKPVNAFLANVDLDTKEDDNTSSRIPFDVTYTYTGRISGSSSSAAENFRINKDAVYSEYLRKFVNDAVARTNQRINYLYGFEPDNSKDYLWIQNSKKHEEYETQSKAIEAVKVLFATMEANKSVDKLKSNLSPLINYLESLKTKYAGDDKNNVKMRYSSYYNLAKIYYYLDMPLESIKEANGLIANDYDKKDGEQLIESAEKLIEEFKRTNLETRHNANPE